MLRAFRGGTPTEHLSTFEPALDTDDDLVMGFMSEWVAGEGEDAKPIHVVRKTERGSVGLLGVFDGLGGGGSQSVALPHGTSWAGARLAPPPAPPTVERWVPPP